jgi:hypothetical protein
VEEKKDLKNLILQWARKDFVVIIVLLLALLACAYTIYTVQSYQTEINNRWLQQWSSVCKCNPYYMPNAPNVTFKIDGRYNNEIED